MNSLDALVGLRLSIIRFYADTLGLHFGDVRPYAPGGTVGAFALHVSCPWRIDDSDGTIVGSQDRWNYGGQGDAPEGWNAEFGSNLRDKQLNELFGQRGETGSWTNETDRYLVIAASKTKYGDLRIDLSDGYTIRLFPAATEAEAWRLFAPDDESPHLVFPAEAEALLE